MAVSVALPLVRGKEVEGGVGFGEKALQPHAELQHLGVAQVGEDGAGGPLAVRGGVEGLVRGLDREVSELAGGGDELPEGLLGGSVRWHGGILAVGRESA